MTKSKNGKYFKYIVIGDGFAGRTVGSYLPKESLLMIKPESSQFSWSTVDGGPFDINGAESFRAVGGGMNLWGGALSRPSSDNFFDFPQGTPWWDVYEDLDGYSLKDLFFSARSPTARDTSWAQISTVNSRLEAEFRNETHGWARSWTGRVMGTRGVRHAIAGFFDTYRITFIRRTQSGRLAIGVTSGGSASATFECDVMVLASGAFINAYLVSLLTGHQSFPLGNHYSANCVILKFSRRIPLRGLVQAVHLFRRGFVTWRENAQIDNLSMNHISFRLVSTRHQYKSAVDGLPASARVRFRLTSWLQLAEELLGRYRQVAVQVWVESPPSPQHEFAIFTDADANVEFKVKSFDARVHIDNARKRALVFAQSVSRAICECFGTVSCSVQPIDGSGVTHWGSISDRLHYFGTVPVTSESAGATVDKNLQLRFASGVFVVGSSTFARGSDAHPTLLIILLARRLGKYLQPRARGHFKSVDRVDG